MIRPLRSLTPPGTMPPPNPPPRRGEPMPEPMTETPVPFARTMAAAGDDAFEDATCARHEPPVRASSHGRSIESAASFSGLPRVSSSSGLRSDDPNATRLAPRDKPTELRGRYDRDAFDADDEDDRRDGYVPQPYREMYPTEAAEGGREDSGPRARPRKQSGSRERERNFAADEDDLEDRAPSRHEARLDEGYAVASRHEADSYDRPSAGPRTAPSGASSVGSSAPPQDETFMPRRQAAFASTEARSFGGGASYSGGGSYGGRGFEYSPPAAGPGNLTRREAAYELPPVRVGQAPERSSWSQQPAPMPHFPVTAAAPGYRSPVHAPQAAPAYGGYGAGYPGGAYPNAAARPPMGGANGGPMAAPMPAGYGAGTMAASPRALHPHSPTRPPTGPTGHVGHVHRRSAGHGGRSGPTPLGHRTQMTEEEPTQGSKVGRFAWFVFGSAFGIFFAFFATGFVPRIGKKEEASFPPPAALPTQVTTATAAPPPRPPPYVPPALPPTQPTTQLGIVIPGAMPALPQPVPATAATTAKPATGAVATATKPARTQRAAVRRPLRSAPAASDDDTSDRRSASRSSDKPEKSESKGEKELGDLLSDGLGP